MSYKKKEEQAKNVSRIFERERNVFCLFFVNVDFLFCFVYYLLCLTPLVSIILLGCALNGLLIKIKVNNAFFILLLIAKYQNIWCEVRPFPFLLPLFGLFH